MAVSVSLDFSDVFDITEEIAGYAIKVKEHVIRTVSAPLHIFKPIFYNVKKVKDEIYYKIHVQTAENTKVIVVCKVYRDNYGNTVVSFVDMERRHF